MIFWGEEDPGYSDPRPPLGPLEFFILVLVILGLAMMPQRKNGSGEKTGSVESVESTR